MGDYLEGAAASNQGTAAGGENNYSLKSASCPQHPTPFLSWGGAINFTRICQHTLAKGAMFGSCSNTGLNKKLLSPEGFSNQPKRYFGLDTTTLEQTETYDIKGNLYTLLLWGLFVVEMRIIGCGQTLLFWNVPTFPCNLVPSSHETKVTFGANHQHFLHPPFWITLHFGDVQGNEVEDQPEISRRAALWGFTARGFKFTRDLHSTCPTCPRAWCGQDGEPIWMSRPFNTFHLPGK